MLKMLRDYLTLGSLATVASVVGIAGGIRSLTSHGGSTGQGGTSAYVPQGQPQADQGWQDLMNRMMQATGMSADMLMPILQQAFSKMNDGTLANQYGQFGDYSRDVGKNLLGSTTDLYRGGAHLWETAADPMNKLHDKLQHDTEQGSRAATTARGIGMSPQAAGLENEATGNFNLNWQQGLLDREARGLQGMTSAYNQAGMNTLGGISALGSSGNFYGQQYGLPFAAANAYSGAMNQGVYSPWDQIMRNQAQYMGMGANSANSNFNQQQTGLNNFTTGLGQFANSPGWGAIQRFFGPPSQPQPTDPIDT